MAKTVNNSLATDGMSPRKAMASGLIPSGAADVKPIMSGKPNAETGKDGWRREGKA